MKGCGLSGGSGYKKVVLLLDPQHCPSNVSMRTVAKLMQRCAPVLVLDLVVVVVVVVVAVVVVVVVIEGGGASPVRPVWPSRGNLPQPRSKGHS